MSEKKYEKVYVGVIAEFTPDGKLIPKTIIWKDDEKFDIDKVISADRRASTKAGGVGMRYECLIGGHIKYIFYEDDNKWFVEGKAG